ncbi:MAG: hypothetical protein JWQ81_5946 [Amycolatopsis sp.]|uniref:hypothetical protein n=1 Tax=Amycolatopsis sp. TaxID=37632 RepID=UPI00260C8115|nr:hypothetical protein [Amycolatopsis sp.]MCU1685207.1 hypothetical protein [Amycolatopsis sp.]
MAAQRWITSLITPARTLNGQPAQIVVGLLNTDSGPQIAIEVGDPRETVIIPEMAATELVISVSQMVVEKHQRQEDTVLRTTEPLECEGGR